MLGAAQHTQDPHGVASDAISGYAGRAENNQFPRFLDAARTAALRKLHQALDLHPDAVIHGDGGLWAVRFDVVEDLVAVGLCEGRTTTPAA
jgi:hypothetical protein